MRGGGGIGVDALRDAFQRIRQRVSRQLAGGCCALIVICAPG